MTIADAIARLQRLEKKFGPTVEVYFDCPHCHSSFTPDLVSATAVHLTQKEKR